MNWKRIFWIHVPCLVYILYTTDQTLFFLNKKDIESSIEFFFVEYCFPWYMKFQTLQKKHIQE